MELMSENPTKLLTWAAQHGSEAPLANSAGETIVIDGGSLGPSSDPIHEQFSSGGKK